MPRRNRRGRAQDIDARIGSKVRAQRMLLGMSQTELASRVGITFQQIQKYENGANRMGASRLYAIASALGVSPGYFFQDLEQGAGQGPTQSEDDLKVMARRETLEPVRYYSAIQPSVRSTLLSLFHRMADNERSK
jgi:transcriptional regulator with XRE-family HTH domain